MPLALAWCYTCKLLVLELLKTETRNLSFSGNACRGRWVGGCILSNPIPPFLSAPVPGLASPFIVSLLSLFPCACVQLCNCSGRGWWAPYGIITIPVASRRVPFLSLLSLSLSLFLRFLPTQGKGVLNAKVLDRCGCGVLNERVLWVIGLIFLVLHWFSSHSSPPIHTHTHSFEIEEGKICFRYKKIVLASGGWPLLSSWKKNSGVGRRPATNSILTRFVDDVN